MNPDIEAQMQQLKDMLDLAINQRNNHQNECLQLGAELVATKRKLAALEKAAAPEAPKANGAHHEDRAAAAA